MTHNTAVGVDQPRTSKLPRWDSKALGWPKPNWIVIGIAVVIAVLIPVIAPDRSWVSVATLAMIWITLGQSWNLVLGYGGVWNFGQLAFYAIGAYAAALLSMYAGLPPWLGMFAGGIIAAGIALLLTIPVLRLRGIYVSLLTFGFAEVVRLLIVADQTGITGGSYGLSGFGGLGFEGLSGAAESNANYWVVLAVAIIVSVVVTVIVRSPLGNGMIALRDNPALAAARGINPRTTQMLLFAISGFIAGVSGALYAYVFKVVAPTLMGLGPMTLIVTMLVVGGLGTIVGPIIGTIIIAFVQARMQEWPEVRLAVLGVVLLVMILLMPRGLVPVISHQWRRLKDWMAEEEDVPADDPDYPRLLAEARARESAKPEVEQPEEAVGRHAG